MPTEKDIIQRVTGNFGRWQLRSIIIVFLCKIPATWFMACISYTAPLPKATEYQCKSDVKMSSVLNDSWITGRQNEFTTFKQINNDKCFIYQTNEINSEEVYFTNQSAQNVLPCDHFEFNVNFESLVSQYELVCSREILVSVTQSFHALGGLIGGFMALNLLKYVSPKRLMLFGMIGQIVCGNLTGLVPTFMLHIYFRCLNGVFCTFMTAGGQVILSDITSGKAGTLVIALSEIFSSFGLILMPGLAIFMNSWDSLYVAMSSSIFFLMYPMRWMTDSPRWFLKHHKISDTLKILLESISFNNRDIPLNLEEQLHKLAKELLNSPRLSYWCIWDGKTPKHYIFLLHWCWSMSVVIYTVMILMIRFIGVDRMYVSTFSMGVAEILGIILGLCIIMYTRRRWLYAGYSMILAGCLTYFLWIIPDTISQSLQNTYELTFWLILKLINSSSLVLLTACTGDLISAEKIPLLMISTGSISRFWLTVVPFSLTLLKIHRLIPITIFASVVLSSGIIMCYFNRHFRNMAQPKIQRIPTLKTYRKMLSVIRSRHSRLEHFYTHTSDESSSSEAGCDNHAVSISMEELWKCERDTIKETEKQGEREMEERERK